jgi:hypothetical protein
MSTQPHEITDGAGTGSAARKVWMTVAGLPLSIELDWPWRRSTAGADFYVLHGTVRLVGTDGLHALVALQMTQTVREVVPSLEPRDVEAPVINILRKEADRKQLEFLKSPKRLPVPFSSRQYDFKRQRWAFGRVGDEQVLEFVRRKVYWQTKLGAEKVWLADPVDLQYLDVPLERMLDAAARWAELTRLEGEYAIALPALMSQAEEIEGRARQALEELNRKHAFERA